jgi:NADH:ubiquinone oxidoreductase subunit D
VCLAGTRGGNLLLPSGSRQGVSFLLFLVKSLTWTYQKIRNAKVGGVAPDNRIWIGWPEPIRVISAADALNDPSTGVILRGSGVTWHCHYG